jgi:hypothetical protein
MGARDQSGQQPAAPPAGVTGAAAAVLPDADIVLALTSALCVSEDIARRATLAVGNSSAEEAANWVLANHGEGGSGERRRWAFSALVLWLKVHIDCCQFGHLTLV